MDTQSKEDIQQEDTLPQYARAEMARRNKRTGLVILVIIAVVVTISTISLYQKMQL